jgi:broad specificity phosphatase PhoE
MGSDAPPRAFLVRHGETEWTRSGRHTSRTDVPLADGGRRQAEALGRLLAGCRFAAVLTSPRVRARETCRLAGFEAAESRDQLAELDYGVYEGRTTDDIRTTEPDWSVWTHPLTGGETLAQAGERVDRVIAEIRAGAGDVAVFAHGHILRIFGARWIGLGSDGGRLLELEPAGISVLGYERETPTVERWNQTASQSLL